MENLKKYEYNFKCENCDEENIYGFATKDVKDAVVSFQKFITEYKTYPIFNIDDFEREFEKIFGTFN